MANSAHCRTGNWLVTGTVSDRDGEPIGGAVVVVIRQDITLGGTAADEDGKFRLEVAAKAGDSIAVQFSCIGYGRQQVMIRLDDQPAIVNVRLSTELIMAPTVNVAPPRIPSATTISLPGKSIEEEAQYSLVPTNPVAAIRNPHVVKTGSDHGSKIRIDGVAPTFYLNGIEIGSDPNHFGAFSVIPAPVLERLSLHPQGTPAEYGLPSAVDLVTRAPFEKHADGNITLSLVEATGTASVGGARHFVLLSARKSVLDKLIKYSPFKLDRISIPPANFQDLFVSAGVERGGTRLMFDFLDSRDILAYRLGPTAVNPDGVDARLLGRRGHAAIRLEKQSRNVRLQVRAGVVSTTEQYRVNPDQHDAGDGLFVDLRASRHTGIQGVEARIVSDEAVYVFGQQIQYTFRRLINLDHRHWNFLPPDASSDNPFIYQEALNSAYGHYAADRHDLSGAGYASVERRIKSSTLRLGMRAEYFEGLARQWAFQGRADYAYQAGDHSRLEIGLGTYASTPITNVLEPYQILTDANRSELRPIVTILGAVNYRHKSLTMSVYRKRIKNLPVVTPDFSMAAGGADPGAGFLTVTSGGMVDVIGGSVAVDAKHVVLAQTDLHAYYAYNRADEVVGNITVPYDLSAPHVLHGRISCHASRALTLGAEATMRSGFAYTPYPLTTTAASSRYTAEYYEDEAGRVNSQRFPTHLTVNLRAQLSFGRAEIFMAISNVTDHENPIINTADGYVYDTGILPTLGLRYSF